MRYLFFIMLMCICLGCRQEKTKSKLKAIHSTDTITNNPAGVQLVVLGTLQDAGAPQLGCTKSCCSRLYKNPDSNLMVTSLGLLDYSSKKQYLIEATPDIARQAKLLYDYIPGTSFDQPDGIFLTHAHIGHYSGLQYLGKEAFNADYAPIYAMPRMHDFILNNGPWSQLVDNANIALIALTNEETIQLTENLSIMPILVPHRDEFSETVGYRIQGPNKAALFIPDIDKWERWDTNINSLIKTVDYAFLDATFYHGEELNTRDISQIPHPFIIESMERFKSMSPADKAKIHFIHFNHTNPVLDKTSQAYKKVIAQGFNIAQPLQKLEL